MKCIPVAVNGDGAAAVWAIEALMTYVHAAADRAGETGYAGLVADVEPSNSSS